MNNNQIDIRILAKDLASQTIKEVKHQVGDFSDTTKRASNQTGVFTGVMAGATAAVVNFGLNLATQAISTFTNFVSDASQAAQDFEKSMITLEIIAPRFGVSADKAKEAAKALGAELRIGVGPAAEALQNLLKGGLNLDQAQELLKRFTNEAMTGKSSSISLAQAVQNLSFAYTTNNSALGNLSGVSENFSDIIEKGREALKKQGMAAEKITDDMAKYKGMIDLTNLTMGSAEKFTGTLTDKQAQLSLQTQNLQVQIGQFLNPYLAEAVDWFSQLITQIEPQVQPALEGVAGAVDKVGEAVNTVKPVFESGFQFMKDWAGLLKDGIISLLGRDTVDSLKLAWAAFGVWFSATVVTPLNVFFKEASYQIAVVQNDLSKAKTLQQEISALRNQSDLQKQLVASGNDPRQFLLNDALSVNTYGTGKISQLSDDDALLYARARGFTKYANGGSFMTNGPQMIMVGDNPGGREQVDVTPVSSTGTGGGKPQNVFNFYGYDMEQVSSRINQQINLGY